MSYWYEGEVGIPIEDVYKFVRNYINIDGALEVLGKPEYRNEELVFPIAVNTECRPLEQVGGIGFETICGYNKKETK